MSEKIKLIRAENLDGNASRSSVLIFALLCLIPVVSTILYGGVDALTWILIAIATGSIGLAWLADAWARDGILIDRNSLLLPLVGLIIIGVIQIVPIFGSGISPELLSIPGAGTLSLDPYATRFFLTRLIIYALFFAAAVTFIDTENRLKKIVLGIVIFGTIMAFFGILQRLANAEAIYGMRDAGQAIPFASFINQHHFASFMEMTGGLAFGLLFGSAIGRDKKVILATAAVIMGVAVVLTSSRGGLLSFIGVMAFVVIVNQLKRKTAKSDTNVLRPFVAIAAAGLGLLIVVFGVVLMIGADSSLMRGIGLSGVTDDISNGRTHFWSIAIRVFLDHPLLGAGFDAFGVAFPKYDSWTGAYRIEQAHNDYLQTLADAGIAGFACVAAFIFLLFKKSLRLISNEPNEFRQSAAIGALAGCFGVMVHSFVDFPLRTPSNTFIFLLLAAIATVSVKFAVKSRRSKA